MLKEKKNLLKGEEKKHCFLPSTSLLWLDGNYLSLFETLPGISAV